MHRARRYKQEGAFNCVNREREWMDVLVPTESDGFRCFNRDNEWMLSLK